MDTLFPLPETLSPRLAWMRKHEVKTIYTGPGEGEQGEWKAWTAYIGEYPDDSNDTGEGDTEDDALADLACNQGIRLWNEEAL